MRMVRGRVATHAAGGRGTPWLGQPSPGRPRNTFSLHSPSGTCHVLKPTRRNGTRSVESWASLERGPAIPATSTRSSSRILQRASTSVEVKLQAEPNLPCEARQLQLLVSQPSSLAQRCPARAGRAPEGHGAQVRELGSAL